MVNLFNRIIAFLLALLMPLGAKISFSKHYDAYRTVFPQGGVETAGGGLFYDFAYSTEKPKPTDNLGQDRDFAVSMARNEAEGCQLTVSSDTEGKTFLLRVSPAKNAEGNTLPVEVWQEYYLTVDGHGDVFSSDFPDPLIPYGGETVTLEKNRSQTFFIEFRADADAPAGKYFSIVSLCH